MSDKTEIFGCYFSATPMLPDASEATKKVIGAQTEIFRNYVWGEKGIDASLKKLKRSTYGSDVALILFQFILNPFPATVEHYRKLESYRKKEKSIGLVLFIDDANFFQLPAEKHVTVLKGMIIEKMSSLSALIRKKKLDTNFEKLERDLHNALQP